MSYDTDKFNPDGSPIEQQKQIVEKDYYEGTFKLPYSFEKKTNKYTNPDHKRSVRNKIAKRRKK